MKNIFKIAFVMLMALALSACGERVEVPPAHIGKIMTKDGYQDGIIQSSKFRLPFCVSYCDKLVLLDTSDKTKLENMTIFIPTDKLNLNLGVQVTLSLDSKETDALFSSLPQQAGEHDQLSLIAWDQIYNTYAQQVIVTETREYLSKYSIAEISSSLEKINNDLRERLSTRLKDRTPFSVRYVGITDLKYPKIITDAQENAAERRERIQQEEAQLEISRVTLERELAEAQLQRQIEVEKAETEAQAQRIQREVIDPRVLQLRALENEAAWIRKWNGQVPRVMMGGEDTPQMLFQIPNEGDK